MNEKICPECFKAFTPTSGFRRDYCCSQECVYRSLDEGQFDRDASDEEYETDE